MKIEKEIVGSYQENCYILSIDNNCIVIDPGDESDKILNRIKDKNVLAILITHGHFDHIGALEELNNIYKVKVFEHNNLSEDYYDIDGFKFKVIFTEGHTDDSVTYYFYNDNLMFTGDFIFKESIGRTDLPTGNMSKMLNSIKKIKNYDDNIILYPGHGDKTNLGYEKKNNYWFLNNL